MRPHLTNIDPALALVKGIRLQPLVELYTMQQCGNEVLTLLSSGAEVEEFFEELSSKDCLLLFFKQLRVIRHLNEPGLFFLNLPVRVLTDPACLQRLFFVQPCSQRQMVIEIQDPKAVLMMNVLQKQDLKLQIQRLRCRGWQVWLDDLTTEIWEEMKDDGFWFDGVKTDRKAISDNSLPELVSDSRKLGRLVLTEGIETEKDLNLAQASGAEWGQGFLWPERTLAFRC